MHGAKQPAFPAPQAMTGPPVNRQGESKATAADAAHATHAHQALHAPHAPDAPRAPRSFTGSWADAHELARAEQEPVFVPVRPFADERGWSLMNLLSCALSEQGQINYSTQYPGVIKAWHLHERQTDFWCCVRGHLKAGVYRECDGRAWLVVIGEQRPGVLIIPPGLWHGATAVGAEPAGLLYYVTRAYDAHDPDEQRRPHDSVRGFPWSVRHG